MNYLNEFKKRSPQEQYAYFLELCNNPRSVQKIVLSDILERNKSCKFGKKCNFDRIHNVKEYQKHVPITHWNNYEEFSLEMEKGVSNILFTGDTLHFIITSGTTGKQKLLPESEMGNELKKIISSLRDLHILSLFPDILKGKFISLANGSCMGHTEGGIPFGSASGLTTANTNKKLLKMLAVPLIIKEINDQDASDYALMRFAISEDVRAIIGNNAGRIPMLIKLAQQHIEEILNDIEYGTLSNKFNIQDKIRTKLSDVLIPNPKRAKQLREAIKNVDDFLPSLYWKNLQVIKCWTSGSVGRYINTLKPFLENHPNDIIYFDAGYGSSECKFNIPIHPNTPYGPLALFSAFYEFIPTEKEGENYLQLHELEDQKEYQLVVTTYSGLYRYDMKDIIRVEGFTNKTPNIAFVSKTSDIANISGEKLTLTQLSEACITTLNKYNLQLIHFCVVPSDKELRYKFYIEVQKNSASHLKDKLAKEIDIALKKSSITYKYYTGQHLLNPLEVILMKPGWQNALYAEKVSKTVSRSQIKLPIIYNTTPPLPQFQEQ